MRNREPRGTGRAPYLGEESLGEDRSETHRGDSVGRGLGHREHSSSKNRHKRHSFGGRSGHAGSHAETLQGGDTASNTSESGEHCWDEPIYWIKYMNISLFLWFLFLSLFAGIPISRLDSEEEPRFGFVLWNNLNE